MQKQPQQQLPKEYAFMHDFFEAFDLSAARGLLRSACRAAESNTV